MESGSEVGVNLTEKGGGANPDASLTVPLKREPTVKSLNLKRQFSQPDFIKTVRNIIITSLRLRSGTGRMTFNYLFFVG